MYCLLRLLTLLLLVSCLVYSSTVMTGTLFFRNAALLANHEGSPLGENCSECRRKEMGVRQHLEVRRWKEEEVVPDEIVNILCVNIVMHFFAKKGTRSSILIMHYFVQQEPNKFMYFICIIMYIIILVRLCGLMVRVPWLQIQRSGFNSRRYQIF
jgi:hypothetical protein